MPCVSYQNKLWGLYATDEQKEIGILCDKTDNVHSCDTTNHKVYTSITCTFIYATNR